MEVRKGYHKTELGVLPTDWNIGKLGTLCKLINGRGFKPYEWKNEGLPIIRIQNLNGSDDYNYFQGDYNRKIEVERDQLLFAWSGSRGTSFGPHIWKGTKGLLNYHTWKVAVNETKIDKRFYTHALRNLTRSIEDSAHGASALVHTQKWEMEGFQISFPSTLAEQTAIATALSDTDALIQSLEKLIAKKRTIKQGAMQELLTGKKRLPGFEGKWEEKRLGSLGIFFKGKGIRKDEVVSDGYPCIRYGEIYTTHNEYIKRFYSFITKETTSQSQGILKGDLLFAGSGETSEEIGKCVAFLGNEEAFAGGDIVVFRPSFSDSLYFGFLFNHSTITAQKAMLGQGDAVVHISAKNLAGIEIKIPPTVAEQTAIAAILSDMDSELTTLEYKLSKYRTIKQGMMQELLTGETRIVES